MAHPSTHPKEINASATDAEWAWAAGLFEGEGSFVLGRQSSGRKRAYLTMKITSTDEDVIRRFHSVVGVGNVNGPYRNKGDRGNPGHWKPHWRWDLVGVKAIALATLPPFGDRLCARRSARLAEILAIVNGQPPPEKDPTAEACCRGHVFTDETSIIRINAKGHRIRECRRCKRQTARERYHADIERHRKYAREWQRRRRQGRITALDKTAEQRGER